MQNLVNNLPTFYKGVEVMIFGMVGIFLVLFLIYIAVKVLIKIFPTGNK